MPFRDMPIACGGGTLAKRYENVFCLERRARAGFDIEAKWECDFKPPEDIRAREKQLSLSMREALYGGRTEVYITRLKKTKKRCSMWTS
jgi:hypothetical protein